MTDIPINPCGLTDRGAIPISSLLSRDVSLEEVKEKLLTHFAEVFDIRLEEAHLGGLI